MVEDQLDNSITKFECISWLSIGGVHFWTFGPFFCVVTTRILNQIHFLPSLAEEQHPGNILIKVKRNLENEMQKKAIFIPNGPFQDAIVPKVLYKINWFLALQVNN